MTHRAPDVEVSNRGRIRVNGKVKKSTKHGKQERLMIGGKRIDLLMLLKRTFGIPECPSGIWPGPQELELWLPVSF